MTAPDRARRGLAVLRVVAALMLVAHGVARASLGIVGDFGLFLTGVGLPAGTAVAWGITAYEVVGGLTLAAGRFVRLLATVFVVELLVGIVLVHAPEGWFVVGAGRNGMEYSTLLVVVLVVLVWTSPEAEAPPERRLPGSPES